MIQDNQNMHLESLNLKPRFGPSKTVLNCDDCCAKRIFCRNGIPGKTVDVEFFQNTEYPLGNVQLELREGSVEQTNDLGFARCNIMINHD